MTDTFSPRQFRHIKEAENHFQHNAVSNTSINGQPILGWLNGRPIPAKTIQKEGDTKNFWSVADLD